MSQDVTMSHTPGEPWWDALRGDFPEALIASIEAESRATSVQVFNASAFPVQVQDFDYLAAVLRSYQGRFPDDMIERSVIARAMRRDAFLRSKIRASIIVDASALRRPVGSDAILRSQHAWARDLHSSGRVPIEVMDGFYYGLETSFTLFTVDGEVIAFEEAEKETVYVDADRRDKLVARFDEFEQRATDLLDHPLLMTA